MSITYVNHVDLLEHNSTWRKYKAAIRELELFEAPASVIKQFKYQAARDCFLAFADVMLDGKLKVAPFHEIIASNFEAIGRGECQRLIVSCPPRSGKSMLSQVFVAWLLGRDQETQHIIASYGAQLSNRFHRGIIGYLKHNGFKRVFPEWMGFEPDSKYDMRGGGYILSTSVGGVLTGFTAGSKSSDSPGVGALVIDDPLKSSDSQAALTGLESFWGEQASTRRTNRWAQVLIGTRFHERDLHGVLMDSDGLWDEEHNPNGWRWINIPGICEKEAEDPLGRKNGESHWPDNPVFAPDMLLSQKRSMGSSAFAALYQGTPTAAEGSIIKPGWITTIKPEDAPTDFDITYLAMDTAFSEKQSADESVIAVMGYRRSEPDKIYVRELIHDRWAFPDLLAITQQTHKYYRAKYLCVEQAASGQSLIQMIERETKIPCHKFKPLKSKTIRLQTVAPLFEANRVIFIEGAWTEDFIKELLTFPFVTHDDRTDAVVWGLTQYLFSMDTTSREANSLTMHGSRAPGRLSTFDGLQNSAIGIIDTVEVRGCLDREVQAKHIDLDNPVVDDEATTLNTITTYKHKHHIIPRYEGGSDDDENLVELTPTQHAMWHFAEWRRKGNWQDKCAWQSLSGLIGREEVHRIASSEGGKSRRGKKGSPNGGRIGGKIGGKIGGRKNVESGHLASISSKGGKTGGKIATAIRYRCLETGFISNAGGLSMYQKSRGIDTSKRERLEQ